MEKLRSDTGNGKAPQRLARTRSCYHLAGEVKGRGYFPRLRSSVNGQELELKETRQLLERLRHSERRKANLVPPSSCHQSPTNGSYWLNPAPSQLTQRAGKYCLWGWVPLQRRAKQGSQPDTGWCGLKSHNSFTLLSPTDGFQRGSYCFPDKWEVGFQPGLNLYLFHYETDHIFTWNTDLTHMYMDWGWEGGRGESQ